MVDTYGDDFKRFLAHTDEKSILLGEIEKDIDQSGVQSVLDIGAGNGDLSIPLSIKVSKYTAVEKKAEFVRTLRQSGIDVIEGTFPISVPDKYGLVLASHSMSYKPEVREPFLRGAWDCVDTNGHLLVITYRGQDDDWTNLMSKIGQPTSDYNRLGYDWLTGRLSSLGALEIRTINTTVKTDTETEMIEALSFVASNGEADRKDRFLQEAPKLTQILRSLYRGNEGFTFPFQHYFLCTHKEAKK